MKIKDISVCTFKNHVETEISFESLKFLNNCYLIQSIYSIADKENLLCQITTGIPSTKVLTCADVIPVFASTKNKKYPYIVFTKIFSEDDSLIEERKDIFEFTLLNHYVDKKKESFFKKFFGKKN